MRPSRFHRILGLIVAVSLAGCAAPEPDETLVETAASGLEFAISFDETHGAEPLDGRVLLLISTDDEAEPRFQIRASVGSMQVFGIDVEGLAPGDEAVVDAGVFGYPARSLAELAPGEYYVQAVLH